MNIPLKVGEIITLQQSLASAQAMTEEYKSRIADLTTDYISIEIPISMRDGRFRFLPQGCEIEVSCYGHDGSQYIFPSYVLGRRKDRIPVTLITHPQPDQVTRIQRRRFFRVPTALDLAVHPEEKGAFEPFLAKTLDISGGGLAFHTPQRRELKEGTKINWWLALPLKDSVEHPHASGKIVRVIEPHEQGFPYKYSIQFQNLNLAGEALIVRYCYDRQLELNKKLADYHAD
jgi:c-di-GMP-binding flagellar brake protein YcgR